MSKEKQCECCHEWWYASDVKENLCPNCYDYFKQLKQQLEEKEKQIDIISRDNNSYKYNIDEQKRIIDDFAKQLKENDNYRLRYELAGADETITNLKEQLAEKDIRIEELEGQFAYECECNKQLVELQKQLEEKQNTIDEINKEFVQAVHDWKVLCAEKDKEISKLQASCQQVKTQLAIQELEKVKDYICDCTYIKEPDYTNVRCKIDQQIKLLKGE